MISNWETVGSMQPWISKKSFIFINSSSIFLQCMKVVTEAEMEAAKILIHQSMQICT